MADNPSKSAKSNKPKARLPRGLADRGPAEIAATRRMPETLRGDDEQWLSLRYDLTAPLARYVAENFQNLPLPYRSYRVGWVFRNEKPGPGRFRQFMPFDGDTVGSSSPAADAEICMS